jgi:hypothetical protein
MPSDLTQEESTAHQATLAIVVKQSAASVSHKGGSTGAR